MLQCLEHPAVQSWEEGAVEGGGEEKAQLREHLTQNDSAPSSLEVHTHSIKKKKRERDEPPATAKLSLAHTHMHAPLPLIALQQYPTMHLPGA